MTYRKLAAVIGLVALFMWSCGGEAPTDTLTARACASRENQAQGDRGPKLTIYYTTS